MTDQLTAVVSLEDRKMRFSDKVAIVTGGNFGIGRGIALRLAAEGATVAIAARDEKRGHRVVEEIHDLGGECEFFKTDVTDEAEIIALIDNVVSQFGKLSLLVNNAGVGSQHCGIEADDPPAKRWQIFRRANLDSTYLACAHALPQLVKNPDSAIVNISSIRRRQNRGRRPDPLVCSRGRTIRDSRQCDQSRVDRNQRARDSGSRRQRRRRLGYAAFTAESNGHARGNCGDCGFSLIHRGFIYYRANPGGRRRPDDPGLSLQTIARICGTPGLLAFRKIRGALNEKRSQIVKSEHGQSADRR
jgi:NAD(P)-dependent dehydrogenase (short-subunit alcohol dehydrogenase family)